MFEFTQKGLQIVAQLDFVLKFVLCLKLTEYNFQ
jgi:hypothetical protein